VRGNKEISEFESGVAFLFFKTFTSGFERLIWVHPAEACVGGFQALDYQCHEMGHEYGCGRLRKPEQNAVELCRGCTCDQGESRVASVFLQEAVRQWCDGPRGFRIHRGRFFHQIGTRETCLENLDPGIGARFGPDELESGPHWVLKPLRLIWIFFEILGAISCLEDTLDFTRGRSTTTRAG